MDPNQCQFTSLPTISEGDATLPHQSLSKQMKFFIRRNVSSETDRKIHRFYNNVLEWSSRLVGKPKHAFRPVTDKWSEPLKAGDLVRVRSKDEIYTTLNHLGQLKGCSFMSGQEPYCGTVQRVLKPMERFVDERDLRVKKCRGLVLLEGVMCEGTTDFGRCDRSCFMFWREEWLEKIAD